MPQIIIYLIIAYNNTYNNNILVHNKTIVLQGLMFIAPMQINGGQGMNQT